jgi:putative protease
MENRNGQAMDYAPGSGHIVRIPKPERLPESLDFSYLTRILSNQS